MLALLVMDAPATEPDEALLAQAIDGSRAAWDALIRKHRRRVLVALLADGRSLDEANELAQEAWSKLWTAQRSGKLARLELPGLVVTQARFLAKDAWRRRKIREGSQVELTEGEAPSTEAQVSSRQQLARVAALLGELPGNQERIFRLAQEDGLPHADIAARVGLSLQRVRQIIYEVRGKLRAALEAP